MGRVGRYTLKIHDNTSGKEYNILLWENGEIKSKVDLMTIDRFINKRYIRDGKYEKFNNKEELRNYLSKFKNINVSNDFSTYVNYHSKGESTNLELIYEEDKTIQYFSQMFLYFKEQSQSYDEVNKKVMGNHIWKSFVTMFGNLILDPIFFEYITKDGIGKTYVVSDFRRLITEYHNNCSYDDDDSIITRREAMNSISRQLTSYKTIRGIQLAINKYNKIKENFEGLQDEYLDSELYQQNYKMPIHETAYYGKNEKIKEEIHSLNDEDMNANIGGYTNSGDLAQKLFEEEGLSLEEVFANPDLAAKLGYIEKTENEGKHR